MSHAWMRNWTNRRFHWRLSTEDFCFGFQFGMFRASTLDQKMLSSRKKSFFVLSVGLDLSWIWSHGHFAFPLELLVKITRCDWSLFAVFWNLMKRFNTSDGSFPYFTYFPIITVHYSYSVRDDCFWYTAAVSNSNQNFFHSFPPIFSVVLTKKYLKNGICK